MQSEYTKQLADRLTTAWREWTTIEMSNLVTDFINDIKNSCNNRMLDFTTTENQENFTLTDGNGGLYFFYYLPATSTWWCDYDIT